MGRIALAVALATVLVIAAAPPVAAQEADEPATEEAPPEAKEKAPAVPVVGEKVYIRLKAGYVLSGVVKGARAEVIRGTRYVKAENREVRGAGVRVYYAMGLNGYLFVPYDNLEEITFQGRLTSDEAAVISRRLEDAKRKAEEDRKRANAEIEALREKAEEEQKGEGEETTEGEDGETTGGEDGETPTTKPDAQGDSPGKGDEDRTKSRDLRIRELLERFPPEKWKPARLDEIKKRAIILDIFPNDEERAFMHNYDLWLEGYEMWAKTKR